MQILYAFLLALSLASVLIPILIRMAGALGMTDTGGGRKVHQGVTPRTGGIAIVSGALASALLLLPPRPDLSAFLAAAVLLFVFGLLDDRYDLGYRPKLLGQTLAASVVALFGGVLITRVPFLSNDTLPLTLALPFTVFVLVAITNAVNLSDGLDGLAGGISLIAVGALALLAYLADDLAAVILALAVMGATFGFLRFNTHPALLFMGDSGSQFLGFSAGVLAVVVTQLSDPALSPVLPVMLLGMPILDTFMVMTGRIARGASPFAADRTHLHHRLLDSGLDQTEAVGLIYGAQFVLAILAYFLRYSADWFVLFVYFGGCAAVLWVIHWLTQHRSRLLARDTGGTPSARLAAYLRKTRLLTRVPFEVLNVAIPSILVLGAIWAPNVRSDIGLLALVLLVVLVILLSVKPRPFLPVERLVAFATAVTVVYLIDRDDWLRDLCAPCGYLIFGGLALTIAVWLRFSSRRFRVNSQDILILLIAATIPFLPELGLQHFGLIALSAVILFYGIEVLMEARERHWDPLRISLLSTLIVLAFKGLVPLP